MKIKLFSFLLMFCLCLTTIKQLQAQTREGNWLLEGNIGNLRFQRNLNDPQLNRAIGDFDRFFTASFTPRIGFFIYDRLVLGAAFNLNLYRSRYEKHYDSRLLSASQSQKSVGKAISPFIRYLFPLTEKSNWYVQLSGGYGANESRLTVLTFSDKGMETYNYWFESKQTFWSADLGLGYNYFFSERLAFNAGISVSSVNSIFQSPSGSSLSTTYGGGLQNSSNLLQVGLNFGFTFILPGRKGNTTHK